MGKLTNKQKNEIEDNAIVTDDLERTNKIVDMRMKAYVVYNAEEHHQTRKVVRKLEHTIDKREGNRFHNVVQDAVIVFILVGMVVLLTGC